MSVQLCRGHCMAVERPKHVSCCQLLSTGEAPARQCLVTRGLLPLLAEGSARATDSDTTDEILHAAIEYSKVGAGDHCSLTSSRVRALLTSYDPLLVV